MSGDTTRPAWTSWSAAYAYASIMRPARRNPASPGRGTDPHAVAKALVAYVIVGVAAEAGIAVSHPRDLAELPFETLLDRVHPVRLAVGMSSWTRSLHPAPGEPGHEVFERIALETDDINAHGQQQLTHAAEQERSLRGGQQWIDRGQDAEKLLTAGMVYCAQLRGGPDLTLGGLADLLPNTDGEDTTAVGLTATLMDSAYAARPWFPISDLGQVRDWWIVLADRIEPRFRTLPCAGSTDWTWVRGEAVSLVQLVMYVAAHDRDQVAAALPWSAARVRLQLGPAGLRDYLTAALTRLGHTDATPHGFDTDIPASTWAEFQDQATHRKRHGVDDPLPTIVPYATELLDHLLIAERGGWAPGTDVLITPAAGGRPWTARILAPVWQHAIPPGEPAARIDVVDGPPTTYTVTDPATGHTQTSHDTITPANLDPDSGEAVRSVTELPGEM